MKNKGEIMNNFECSVFVVEHPSGVFQGCRVCNKILKKGRFLIGLLVRENEEDYKYLLGLPPQIHCGEQKNFLECFETEKDAEDMMFKVVSHLSESGAIKDLPLMAFFDLRLN